MQARSRQDGVPVSLLEVAAVADQQGYIGPTHASDPLAGEFAKYLDAHLRWSPGDFPDGIAWDRPIPPKAEWLAEVEKFNATLARLEREGWKEPNAGELF